MDSITDWGTLELSLGGVARISQVDQVSRSIPWKRNRDAEVTWGNRKFFLWLESKALGIEEKEFEGRF